MALSACAGNDTQVAVSLAVSTTVPATTTVAVPATTVAVPATTVEAPATTSVPGESSTTLAKSRPRLVLSQADGLDPKGTLITVSGSGFDTSKGVYVFVCNQATWNAKRRCIGGINMDGESPLSQWISSNPPGYAKGLTIEFGTDGSFAVPLLVRAIDESTSLIDCSKEQCGVVAFADHTRRDDRSQDVFVPISFASSN
jgi:hypothetical protein